ncbi:hypothetical protein MycrhDRAFT_6221 [Mycolicibacterium rhodesiae JS60]|nr:hypothetical protein MycrhDRAFT_6221 [Mycolicibacterium rhodesiae JS60]
MLVCAQVWPRGPGTCHGSLARVLTPSATGGSRQQSRSAEAAIAEALKDVAAVRCYPVQCRKGDRRAGNGPPRIRARLGQVALEGLVVACRALERGICPRTLGTGLLAVANAARNWATSSRRHVPRRLDRLSNFQSRWRIRQNPPSCFGIRHGNLEPTSRVGSTSTWRMPSPLPELFQNSAQDGGRLIPFSMADPRTTRLSRS